MDNKLKKKHDGVFVNTNQAHEMRYRAKAWKYSIIAIKVAVFVTKSNTAKKVKAWLDKNWKRIVG